MLTKEQTMQQEMELVVYFSAVEHARKALWERHAAERARFAQHALRCAADRVRKAVEEAQED